MVAILMKDEPGLSTTSVPVCKQCKYSETRLDGPMLCNHPEAFKRSRIDVVSGKYIDLGALVSRTQEGHCGPEGKHFKRDAVTPMLFLLGGLASQTLGFAMLYAMFG